MKKQKRKKKILISGGGTGGHIYPAIAIANELKKRDENTDILFVGAKDRMEIEKVPEAGYKILGLPVNGLSRKLTIKNLVVLFKLIISLIKARKILKEYNPDLVIGVGGYASGPVLRIAAKKGIPTLIQEQNSHAGITNRILGKRARTICVAYKGMEKYFPKDKIVITGNPVREYVSEIKLKTKKALKYFNLTGDKKVLLIMGGSLGAQTINESITANLDLIAKTNIDVIWQTGKHYFNDILENIKRSKIKNIKILDFINRMDYAYSVADVIVARAGGSTISELCLAGKPIILVPSPNVAEDHQTKNAMALVKNDAALMIKDSDAKKELIPEAIKLINNSNLINTLSRNLKKMGIENSAERIVDEIYKLLN
jgi:UDP-N-acetylglucosamine--N-acetylmuramyl-(pentapeptide) pyrophosphoryl-undecaprenol N-acetylglucosamine transferase